MCDIPVISQVCDVAGEGAGALVTAPFNWLASAVGKAAVWMFDNVWKVFDTTTLIDITRPGYVRVYNVIFGVAIFVMLTFFLLQLITGLIRRDPAALSRAALGLAKSVLGSFLVITLTATLLEITDRLSEGIVQATGMSMDQMGERIAALAVGLTAISIGAPGVGAILTVFLGALAISAAVIVWFSLLVRKALLLVAIVLAPIALSGASWDATKGWIAKWAAFVIALIFAKPVVVVVFLVAVNQVSAPIDADLASISDPIAGIVLMFVAGFAPYLVYKFISFIGVDYWHTTASEREAKQALNRPVPMPRLNRNDLPKVLEDPGSGTSRSRTPNGTSGGGGSSNPGSPGGIGSGPTTTDVSKGAAGSAGAAGTGALAGVGAAATAAGAATKTGDAVGHTAEEHAAGASNTGQPTGSTGASAPSSPPSPGPAPTKTVDSVPGESHHRQAPDQ